MPSTGVTTRKRPCSPRPAKVQCHVVDDHCDALRHIHAAIRRRALPFEGVAMMHWDAHPDLMVTPDMPASTCFRPHELYESMRLSEGGIAEWILPLVYQGHLSRIWWIRPPWSRQFTDGEYNFSVGQVKETGKLRVSSTAPYFVDDRLHCPEASMRDAKPLRLSVSLPPDVDKIRPPSMAKGAEARDIERLSYLRTITHQAPLECAERDDRISSESTLAANGQISVVIDNVSSRATPAGEEEGPTGDEGPTTWILDICLDFFTTENPFWLELEAHLGKADADLVRDFYQKPRFRGATTQLPHHQQLAHELTFKSEVERLLRTCGREERSSGPCAAQRTATSSLVGIPANSLDTVHEGPGVHGVTSSGTLAAENKSSDASHQEGANGRGLERLSELFASEEPDCSLPRRFASLVERLSSKERDLVTWTDHCACLPRHLATREEVRSSVRMAERYLSSLREVAKGDLWNGLPGVVTVARSSGDGYVPPEMVGFVEREVLAMLGRLYAQRGENVVSKTSLEILYEEGLRPL